MSFEILIDYLDIEPPPAPPRHAFGNDLLDDLFPERGQPELRGLPAGSSVMLIGPNGIGKTDLALKIATMLAEANDGRVMVNTNEEPVDAIHRKLRHFGLSRVCYLRETHKMSEIEAAIDAFRAQHPDVPLFVVLDSLTYVDNGGAEEMARIYAKAKATGTTFITVVHQTKAGSHRGSQNLMDRVDVKLVYQRFPDGNYLHVERNRFGLSGNQTALRVEAVGNEFFFEPPLPLLVPEPEPEQNQPTPEAATEPTPTQPAPGRFDLEDDEAPQPSCPAPVIGTGTRTHRRYTDEDKALAVAYYRQERAKNRTLAAIAKELKLDAKTLKTWVEAAGAVHQVVG